MAMRQLGCNIRVLSRTATVGSAANQFHPMTGGGAAFSHRRFFCTELPSPQRRRTQGLIDYMKVYTHKFVKGGILFAGGTIMVMIVYPVFPALGFDIRKKLRKMLLVKKKKED